MEINTEPLRLDYLTSLPPELFAEIVARMLEVIGMLKAVRLRVLAKLFDAAIVHAVCNSYLYDKDGPVHLQLARRIKYGMAISPQMMGNFLLAEMERNPKHYLLSPIREAIQALDKNSAKGEKRQPRNKRLVCEAMAERLFWGYDGQLGFLGRITTGGFISRETFRLVDGEVAQIALSVAIVVNDILAIQALLAECPDVNTGNRYFGRPLHLAAKWGNTQIVKFLLDFGADAHLSQGIVSRQNGRINGTHGLYYTTRGKALEVATLAGQEEIVWLLLQHKFSKDRSNRDFAKAIENAARGGHAHLISTVMEKSYNENEIHKCEMLERTFFVASIHGREDLVKLMLAKGVNVNSTNKWGGKFSALQLAALHGHVHVMRLLLDYGINRDLVYENTSHCHANALAYAGMNGYEEAVQLLLDYGADVNTNLRGGCVIQKVARMGQSRMLYFLLKNGADLNIISEDDKNRVGENMLIEAVRDGQSLIVRILVQAGIPPNNPEQPIDPVLNAMAYGRAQVLKTLMELGGREIDPMESCFAEEFRTGKYPLHSEDSLERSCHWLGRY